MLFSFAFALYFLALYVYGIKFSKKIIIIIIKIDGMGHATWSATWASYLSQAS